MIIMDFSHTPRQAFANGFMKGFTAPTMLFGQHEIPKLQEVSMIPMPNENIAQALGEDWKKIGLDF